MKRRLLAVLAVALLATLCAICGNLAFATCTIFNGLSCYQAGQTVDSYYAALEQGDFARAATYVYDLTPAAAQETPPAGTPMQQLWADRMRRLKESDTYLVEVGAISMRLEDGYPLASAEVTLMEGGQVRRATHTIHLKSAEQGWKIGSVSSGIPGQVTLLDRALSGQLAAGR